MSHTSKHLLAFWLNLLQDMTELLGSEMQPGCSPSPCHSPCPLVARQPSHPVCLCRESPTYKHPLPPQKGHVCSLGPASCPRSSRVTQERGGSSSREPQILDQTREEGRKGGWVRRHALNWHWVASVSWVVSVSTVTSTIMAQMSYVLWVYSVLWVNKHLWKSFLSSTER